jgi:hypothetical protein
MDVAFANAAASGLPGLLFVGWSIVAFLTAVITREFLEKLKSELH